jgi:hypothetical protein
VSFLSRRIRRCGEIRGIAVHVEQLGQPSVKSGMRSFKTSGVDHRRHAGAFVRLYLRLYLRSVFAFVFAFCICVLYLRFVFFVRTPVGGTRGMPRVVPLSVPHYDTTCSNHLCCIDPSLCVGSVYTMVEDTGRSKTNPVSFFPMCCIISL